MAFTQTQLDAIEKALARGERVVQYADRRVEYRSVAELIELRNTIQRDLAQQNGQLRKRSHRLYHAGKGI
ncbi:phage head-tail joining protein [Vogesella sp. GCM10023246]|uniref:GpW protein n=1 Tax=Vogesella oryzagri TaxID=3160864 RepID=A0ABV1M2S0_9NEIS